MYQLFVSSVLAGVLGVFPAKSAEDWRLFGSSDQLAIHIDLNSLEVKQEQGWEVKAKIKLTPPYEIPIEGKKKRGAYYIEEFIVYCLEDYLIVRDKVLYSKDGEILKIDMTEEKIPNLHQPGEFVTEYIQTMCIEDKPQKSKQFIRI